jgi:hypothetical protein
MPFLGIGLHLLVAIFFAVHALRNRKQMYWLLILFSFPLLGSLVYFIVEYLPEMRQSRGGRKVVSAVVQAVNPEGELREREREFERSPTSANQYHLGNALVALKRYDAAAEHFSKCASGPYSQDAAFVRALANAQMMSGHWPAAREAFDRLFAIPHVEQSADDALGYAFVLGQLNDAGADEAFRSAVTRSNGPIARCRYAQYLIAAGRGGEAKSMLEEVQKEQRLAPEHTRDLYRDWYKLAHEELAKL